MLTSAGFGNHAVRPKNGRLFPLILIPDHVNNLTPTYISDLLTPMSQSHKRTLRSATDGSIAVPRSKTAMFDGSFSCSAPRLWNDLPECVRSAPSLNVFKKKVRERFKDA